MSSSHHRKEYGIIREEMRTCQEETRAETKASQREMKVIQETMETALKNGQEEMTASQEGRDKFYPVRARRDHQAAGGG
jgi:hypothetical protein